MRKLPPRNCRGPILPSNVQAFPGNLYRSGLGVGISSSIKKCPQVIYRPGIGYQQPACCIVTIPVRLRNIFDGGTPFVPGTIIIDGNGGAAIIDGGKP